MFFLIIFSLAIAGITVTELPIVIFLLRSPVLILFILSKIPYFSLKLRFIKKWFIIASFACFLALLSWQIYQRRYGNLEQTVSFISTGTIADTLSSGKYLYTDGKRDYLLYSQISHIPGNKIRLVARNSLTQIKSPSLYFITQDSIFYSGFN